MIDIILFTLLYIEVSLAIMSVIRRLTKKLCLHNLFYFLFLFFAQYINTVFYMFNSIKTLTTINMILLIISLVIGLIFSIYYLISSNSVQGLFLAIFLITTLTLFVLGICIGLTSASINGLIFALLIIFIYMFIFMLAIKKMKKELIKFIYACFLLALGIISVISLIITYQKPTEITTKVIRNSLYSFLQVPEKELNDQMSIILFFIKLAFIFVIFTPLISKIQEYIKKFIFNEKDNN